MLIRKELLLVVTCIVSSTSFAAAIGTLDLSSGSAGFANTPVGGSFVDTSTFTLGADSIVNSSLISNVVGSRDIDLSSVSISGPSGTFSLSVLRPDPIEIWATPAAGFSLGAGTYTLTISGTNRAAGGSYGGNIASTPVGAAGTYGNLAGGGALDLSSGSSGFFGTPSSGAFAQFYTFSVPTLSAVGGGVTSVVNGGQDIDFTSISLSGPNGLFGFFQLVLDDPIEAWSSPLGLTTIGAGSYTLALTGFNSSGQASYGGNLAIVSLVPVNVVSEPTSLAALVLALCLCGAVRSYGLRGGVKPSGELDLQAD